MTKIELNLITDPDIFMLFEKRGRIFDITNRYCKASKKCLKFYGSKQEPKHIVWIDAINSYGYAIAKFLPKSWFKFIDPEDPLIRINILAIVKIDMFPKLISNIVKNYTN